MSKKQNQFDFADETTYPPSASASPSNAHYLNGCAVVQHRPAYCSCLAKIDAHKAGGLDSMFAGCGQAINHKTCVALSMRSEEELAGRAIYFINREKLRAYVDERTGTAGGSSEALPTSFEPRQRPTVSKPAPRKSSSIFPLASDGYAAAINAGLAELTQQPAPASVPERPKQPAPIPALAPVPGESMVAFAKRMAAQRAAAV